MENLFIGGINNKFSDKSIGNNNDRYSSDSDELISKVTGILVDNKGEGNSDEESEGNSDDNETRYRGNYSSNSGETLMNKAIGMLVNNESDSENDRLVL